MTMNRQSFRMIALLAIIGLFWLGRPIVCGPMEPPQVAVIKLFAEKVFKNQQGCWEAQFEYGIEMVFIPEGEFLMGTSPGEPGREKNEGPLHRVYLDGYWIGKTEVTQLLWRLIMNDHHPAIKPEEELAPANRLSWIDAQKFIKKINLKTGLWFRLPTEAEWEKACRAGIRTSRYAPLDKASWYADNSSGRSHRVGLKQPNGYGLHDMLGNVWEWGGDWYDNQYYTHSPYKNPKGPARGSRRVVRGGGFNHGLPYLRSGHRNGLEPERSRNHLGLRLVMPAL